MSLKSALRWLGLLQFLLISVNLIALGAGIGMKMHGKSFLRASYMEHVKEAKRNRLTMNTNELKAEMKEKYRKMNLIIWLVFGYAMLGLAGGFFLYSAVIPVTFLNFLITIVCSTMAAASIVLTVTQTEKLQDQILLTALSFSILSFALWVAYMFFKAALVVKAFQDAEREQFL